MVLICSEISVVSVSAGSAYDMKRLIDDLFEHYNPVVRPARSYDKPIKVTVQIFIHAIHALNIKEQFLHVTGFVRMSWRDEMLQWEPSKYGNVRELVLPQGNIWRPDIQFVDVMESNTFMSGGNTRVGVSSEGLVRWEPQFVQKFACKVDPSKYPFDVNRCPITVVQWQDDKSTVVMKLEPVSLCNMTANGEYEVTYEGYSLHPISYRFTEETYDWASFTIKLSRRSSYVGISLVLPVILISLLSPVAYLLHPGDTNKFPVAVSTLLSFTVFLQVLDSNLPDTSDNLGLLAVYVSAMLTLGFLSALGNCIVSVLESDFKNARALGITPSLMPSTQPPETTLEKREGLNQPKPASGREETSSFEKEKDLQKCQDRNFLCLRLPCNEWTATIIRVSGFSGKSPAQKLNNAFLLVHIFIFIICTTVLGAMMLCE